MYLVKMAWNNLRYNTKRSIALILLIAVAAGAILLYQGYVEYSRAGMAAGYINSNGSMQIALNSYWNKATDSETVIDAADLQKLYRILDDQKTISFYDSVLEYNGIIGNENNSAIFWAKGYDHPEKHFGVSQGTPIFSSDDGIVIGSVLAQKLHFVMNDDGIQFLSLMSNSPEAGLCLGSFHVSGIVDTGVPQNDEGLLLSTRQTALSLLNMEDAASYVQVYLHSNETLHEVKKEFEAEFKKNKLPFSIKTWEELNPSFKQVNDLNETQFFIISLILGLLIFISLMQTLSTAFLERLDEFGTIEAIGMPKRKIIVMLLCETVFLILFGLAAAGIVSCCADKFVNLFNIKMTPPGYSISYPLQFYFVPVKVFHSILFVIASCFFAVLIPICAICRNTVVRLINHI
jgi:putative ABC transport system permease protein